jgi:23S rRNA pseudouridine1911/1915/1917 synthase
MAVKKLILKTTSAHQNRRLDQVLAEWLPTVINQPVSKGKVRKLIVAGAVYLNTKRVRIASKELMANAKVDVFIDLEKLNSDAVSKDSPFVMTEDRVLFEDEYLIAVNKPPGLPTQPTVDEARDNLYAAVKKFLARRPGAVATPYVGLHHRLDRDTSGIILFTKSTDANAGIATAFSQHLAVKVYNALVIPNGKSTSVIPDTWQVKNYLGQAKVGGKKGKYSSVRSGGDFAHTDFKLLGRSTLGLWIEARPRTGRTHQIRIHLSEEGLPILGDLTYGGTTQVGTLAVPRLMLHAASLTFPHPIHQSSISIQSTLPEDFSRCLKGLQSDRPSS